MKVSCGRSTHRVLAAFLILAVFLIALQQQGLVHGSVSSSHQRASVSEFVSWAKALAVEDEIALIYVSDQFAVMAYNCYLSLKRQGLRNVGMLTTTERMRARYEKLGVPVFDASSVSASVPEDVQLGNKLVPKTWDISRTRLDWASRWTEGRTKFIWKHWALRDYLIYQLLLEGLSVFNSDTDVIFFDDPYKWVKHRGVALVGQTQDWPRKASLNMGIGRISPKDGGLLHAETVLANTRYLGGDPQSTASDLIVKMEKMIGKWTKVPCQARSTLKCNVLLTPLVKLMWINRFALPHVFDLPEMKRRRFLGPDGLPKKALGIHGHVDKKVVTVRQKTEKFKQWAKPFGLWYLSTADEEFLRVPEKKNLE